VADYARVLVQPGLIFPGVESNLTFRGAPESCSTRTGSGPTCEALFGTNTLAYFAVSLVVEKERFKTLTLGRDLKPQTHVFNRYERPGVNLIKPFFFITDASAK